MKTPIDLGRTYDEMGSPCCVADSSDTKDTKHYPTFHYAGDEELGLPDEGVMTIRFCLKRETSGKREDGKHYYECDIAVEQIVSVKGEKSEAPARSGSAAADALDKIAEALGAKDDEY